MSQTNLAFQWTTFTIVISIVTLIVACLLGWFAWRRSGYRKAILWLELVRIAIVACCVMLLNQPETEESFKPTDKPTVVILADQSISMETQDAGFEGAGFEGAGSAPVDA